MIYCTYCAEALTKPFKVCPHCNKLLDLDVLMQLYQPGKTSRLNRKAHLKIWLTEHSRVLVSLLSLLVGLSVGAVVAYSFGQRQFRAERDNYESRVASLSQQIQQKDSAIGKAKTGLQGKLDQKEEMVTILSEQKEILSRIIRFTSRLAQNSTITPDSVSHADYFRRNVRYLDSQFQALQEKLQLTGYTPIDSYNLQTIPQLMQP